MDRKQLNDHLPQVVDAIVKSVVEQHPHLQHLNRVYLPSRDEIIKAIDGLRQLVFPGYFGKQGLTTANVPFRLGELVIELSDLLYEQVRCCLRYREQLPGANGDDERCEACDHEAARIIAAFFERIPGVRDLPAQDVTLGALAPSYGQMLRGQKQHPTIEDDVTIYAGATILGGDTVIGKGATIGGNVFITSSVPPLNQVSAEPPKLKYRDRRPKSM